VILVFMQRNHPSKQDDVLAWLKRQGSGYQTRINKLLREAMEGKRRRA
jgi:BrnA antitoxin of type II toxin-antitoxin system